MIEKRAPRVSDDKVTDDDDLSGANSSMHDDDVDHFGDEDHDADGEDGVIDAEAEAARRKRSGNLVFFGGGLAALLVIGFIAYPTFKKQFLKDDKPKQVAGFSMPQASRENHFKLADMANTEPAGTKAPAGAFVPAPVATPAAEVTTPTPPPETASAKTTMADVTPPVVVPLPVPTQPSPTVVANTQTVPAAVSPVPVAPVAVSPSPALPAAPLQATGSKPALPVPPITGMPDIAAPAASEAHITDLGNNVAALQASVATLTASRDTEAAQLKELQASIDSLQRQIADMASVRPATVKPASAAESATPKPKHTTKVVSTHTSGWTLRSATSDMALLGKPGDNDLQKVAVGDSISGLGKILSISEQNGHWVVKGTGGSVSQ